MNYAKEFKEDAAKTEKLFHALKNTTIPELDYKYKEFCKDEQKFLKNYYNKDHIMFTYVQKLLDGKAEY